MKLSLGRKLVLTFTLLLSLVAASGYAAFRSVERLRAAAAWVAQTQELRGRVEAVSSRIKDVESGVRGFVITGDERFLVPYHTGLQALPGELAAVRRLSGEDPRQQRALDQLEGVVRRRLAIAAALLRTARLYGDDRPRLLALVRAGQLSSDALRRQFAALQTEEARLLNLHAAGEEQAAAEARGLAVLAGVLALGVGLVAMGLLVRDANARQRAEDALRDSEERYRAFSFATFEGVALHEEGTFLDVNPAFARKFGYGAEELMGADGLEVIAPADRERTSAHIRSGSEEPFEGMGLRKDGSTFPIEIRGRTISYGGRTIRVTVVRDLTARKQAEEALRMSELKFRGLVEAASDIIYHTDPDGRFTYLNPAVERVLRVPTTVLLGMHYSELLREDFREETDAFYARQLRDGTPTTYNEVPIVTPDGTEVWLGVNLELLMEGKRFRGAQAVARDVTARRAVEREKDEILGVVSHELRSPLTAIRGSLGLLASGRVAPEKVPGLVEVAQRNTDRLLRLINEYLDLERLDSGAASMHVVHAELADLMRGAVDSVSALAEAGRVVVEVRPLRLPVRVDSDRMVQVLVNLLANAIKFSPEGQRVVLSARTQAGHLLLDVQDQGRGIPAHRLASIFGRFQQVERADEKARGGTGLGLAISKAIVEHHGGSISVESVLGRGSTFTVRLPLESPGTGQDDARLGVAASVDVEASMELAGSVEGEDSPDLEESVDDDEHEVQVQHPRAA